MKQLLFCYKEGKDLYVRYTILSDVTVTAHDIVSPQKTTLKVPKTNEIELSDIIIVRDNSSGKIEYIGYIDTLVNKEVTEISCYPLINVFDNDFVLDQMFKKDVNADGTEVDVEVDAVVWLETQIKREFVDTEDWLQALPLIIRRKANSVLYKRVLDTANLFEAYLDLFVNTGLYVEFNELEYDGTKISIYCDICCNKTEDVYALRYDDINIQKVDIVDNTFTNYNKVIATEEIAEEDVGKKEPRVYVFYLLDNNDITQNANHERRIKQVRSKAISFSVEDTDEDTANALMLAVYNELQAPEYNLQITIDMLKNDKVKLYRRVDFYAESGIIYSSNITKIEKLNDLQVRVTLGALRNSLTDFKKKVEVI